QYAVGIESRVDPLQLHEAANHKSRADEQRQGKSELRDDEQAPQPFVMRAFGSSADGGRERRVQVTPRTFYRRHQAEEHAAQQRYQHREAQHLPIDAYLIYSRQTFGT